MEQEIIQLEKLLNQVIDYIDKRIQIESLEKSNLDKIQNLFENEFSKKLISFHCIFE